MEERKRLYRCNDDMIAGVAGGVADYFEVDRSIVRGLWLASALCLGIGLGLYIILWIVVPEE